MLFLLAPLELGTVDPDAMQNDSELAGDSGLGLLDADAFWPAAHPKLSTTWCQSKISTNIAGTLEGVRVIDRAAECQSCTGPTPGTVIRRRVVSSPLASLRIWTS
jgi:hypothetical protein